MSLKADFLNRLKRVNDRVDLLINGYVRLNTVSIVPYGIVQICILYFMLIEEWDVNNKGTFMKISGLNNQICECTNPEQDPGHNYNSVLGTVQVTSGKHHWKFKISKLDKIKAYWRIVVGIIKINEVNDEELGQILNQALSKHAKAYGAVVNYDNNSSFKTKPLKKHNSIHQEYEVKRYGQCCENVGDVIDMYLDLDNFTLSYTIKGVNYGNAFDNIDKAKYKMIMTLSRIGTAVELVSYQEIDEIPTELNDKDTDT